jgi:hypothetical protein
MRRLMMMTGALGVALVIPAQCNENCRRDFHPGGMAD